MIRLALLALFAYLLTASPAAAVPVAAVAAVIGVSATSFVAVAATFVVNTVITAVANFAISKAFGPKAPSTAAQTAQERQASVLQLAIGEVPREAIFGEAATGGSLLGAFNYGGQYGTDWVVKVVAVADHLCHALTGFYVGDTFVEFGGDGPVTGYNGQLAVYWRNGAEGQTFPADLLAAWQGSPLHADNAPASADIYKGIAYVVVAYMADAPDAQNPVWSGHPQFLFQVKGKRCYDPRKDTTVGGSGAHRWSDPATWEWTRNAAVCRYNWVRGVYALDRVDDPSMLLVGRGLSTVEAPPQRVFAYANLCDELVDDGAGGTEPRYLVDGVIRATDSYLSVEEMFQAAMAGQVIQPEGGVEVEPGQAKTPVFAITDADLLDGESIEFSDFLSDADRVNTVVGRYIEPAQKWQDTAAPVQRDDADILADGGPREETVPLSLVTRATQAQRVTRIRQKKARLERRGKVAVGARFAEAEEGDWIEWTSARHTKGLPVVFVITSVSQDQGWGCFWTLEEISFDVFGFGGSPLPHTGGQTPTPAPGTLALSGVDAQAIQIEGASGALVPAIRLVWDTPVDAAINRIRAEVRRTGHNEVSPTVTEATADGVMIVTNGVAADADLEARLVPLGGPGRPVAPSPWIAVFTGELVASGVRLIGGRTPAQVLADIAGVAEQGRQLTQMALELALRDVQDQGVVLEEIFHHGVKTKRILIDDDQVVEEGDRSLWWRTDGIAYVSDDGEAMVLRKDSLLWDPVAGQSVAEHLDLVVSQIGDNLATAISDLHTWVNNDSAGAEWINSLEVAFGGNFQGSITQTASVVSGMGATWTLATNVNGKIAGMRHVNDGATSSMVFLTDQFAVTNGSSDVYPFAVVGSEVWMSVARVGAVFANSIVTQSLVGGAVTDVSYASGGSSLSHTVFSEGGVMIVDVYGEIGADGSGDVGCVFSVSGGGLSGSLAVVCQGGFGQAGVGKPFAHQPGAGFVTYNVSSAFTSGSGPGHVNGTFIRVTELKR